MICKTCGDIHSDQKTNYPVGATVVLLQRIPERDKFLPIGSVGRVIGHCDDGRAVIRFENSHLCDHTFHYPMTHLSIAFPDEEIIISDETGI